MHELAEPLPGLKLKCQPSSPFIQPSGFSSALSRPSLPCGQRAQFTFSIQLSLQLSGTFPPPKSHVVVQGFVPSVWEAEVARPAWTT